MPQSGEMLAHLPPNSQLGQVACTALCVHLSALQGGAWLMPLPSPIFPLIFQLSYIRGFKLETVHSYGTIVVPRYGGGHNYGSHHPPGPQ